MTGLDAMGCVSFSSECTVGLGLRGPRDASHVFQAAQTLANNLSLRILSPSASAIIDTSAII